MVIIDSFQIKMDPNDFHRIFRGFFGLSGIPGGGGREVPPHRHEDFPYREDEQVNPRSENNKGIFNFQVFTNPLGKGKSRSSIICGRIAHPEI